jgi:hypothetical protein
MSKAGSKFFYDQECDKALGESRSSRITVSVRLKAFLVVSRSLLWASQLLSLQSLL